MEVSRACAFCTQGIEERGPDPVGLHVVARCQVDGSRWQRFYSHFDCFRKALRNPTADPPGQDETLGPACCFCGKTVRPSGYDITCIYYAPNLSGSELEAGRTFCHIDCFVNAIDKSLPVVLIDPDFW